MSARAVHAVLRTEPDTWARWSWLASLVPTTPELAAAVADHLGALAEVRRALGSAAAGPDRLWTLWCPGAAVVDVTAGEYLDDLVTVVPRRGVQVAATDAVVVVPPCEGVAGVALHLRLGSPGSDPVAFRMSDPRVGTLLARFTDRHDLLVETRLTDAVLWWAAARALDPDADAVVSTESTLRLLSASLDASPTLSGEAVDAVRAEALETLRTALVGSTHPVARWAGAEVARVVAAQSAGTADVREV